MLMVLECNQVVDVYLNYALQMGMRRCVNISYITHLELTSCRLSTLIDAIQVKSFLHERQFV
jgi:hypothetical protein